MASTTSESGSVQRRLRSMTFNELGVEACCGPQTSDNGQPDASKTIVGNEYLTGKGCAVAGPPLQCLGALLATEWVNWQHLHCS